MALPYLLTQVNSLKNKTIQTNLESTEAITIKDSNELSPGVSGILPIANGGTGASTTDAIRENLGLNFTPVIAVTDGVIDISTSTIFTQTISEDITFTFTGCSDIYPGACFTLILTGGSSYTVTWPSNVLWANGSVPDLDDVDVLTFVTPDAGTTWYGIHNITNAA